MTDSSAQAPRIEQRAAIKRAALVEKLVASGDLTTAAWREAFAAVPRHVFVPRYLTQPHYQLVDGANPDQHDEWLDAVYADRTLITAQVGGMPTSSGTMPSLVAYILEHLDIADGHKVVQVGTGTGYTAALLAQRLGDDAVVSIDIDPDLSAQARERLAATGHRPLVLTGNGADGHPPLAPYDRIVATCAIGAVPPAWPAQTRRGGIILAPLAAGFARLTVHDPHTAEGAFLDSPAYFMPLRPGPTPDLPDDPPPRSQNAPGDARPTELSSQHTIWNNDFRFYLSLHAPELAFGRHGPTLDHATVYHPDGSTARLDPTDSGPSLVTQAGPRRLWDQLESTHKTWEHLGKPSRERYRIILTPQRQSIWLDHPDSGRTWQLPL
ncbi:MAG: methyltransferase domain-containing protein [Streptomycetales bacterium]